MKWGIVIAIVLYGAIIGSNMMPSVEQWWKQREDEKVIAELQAKERAIGDDATVTAAIIGSANRQCDVIDAGTLEQCAAHHGVLTLEQVAPRIAQMAVESRISYYAGCMKMHERSWCQNLLRQAIIVSARSKALSTQGE